MPLYHSIGGVLVSNEELIEKEALGMLERWGTARRGGEEKIEFQGGTARSTVRDAVRAQRAPDSRALREPVPFTPIGLGKPLTIEVRCTYSGSLPRLGVFDREKDLLLTTAVKSQLVYAAAPRAVNHVKKNVGKRARIDVVEAVAEGTPIVYHSPAMTDRSLTVTAEQAYDDFPDAGLSLLGGVLQGAGALPVFASASAYLVAAGTILKLAASLGKALFDGRAEFSESQAIDLFRPGKDTALEGYKLFVADEFRATELARYEFDPNGVLVAKEGGRPYDKDYPYVTLSFDGSERPELGQFVPTHASAAILDRFYNLGENRAEPASVLLDGLGLYNDLTFRQRADEAARRMYVQNVPWRLSIQKAWEEHSKFD